MKAIYSLLFVAALSLSGCAHKGHHCDHASRDKASCCKEKEDCKGESCKLKKEKKCCSKEEQK